MRANSRFLAVAGAVLVGVLVLAFFSRTSESGAAAVRSLPGLAAVTGSVSASGAFKAAQVHLMNVEKNVLFMVYTSGGRFRAINLLPGTYEVSVRTKDFASDPQRVVVEADAEKTIELSLREAAPVSSTSPRMGERGGRAAEASFDELYPAGAGRDLALKRCAYCHGKNFLPSRQFDAEGWNAAVDMMSVGSETRSVMIPPGIISPEERRTLVDYLSRHFGPGSTRRVLRVDAEFPVDEDALSKAMYIEYYLPLDPKLDAKTGRRRGQDPYFDAEGNVWYTDRSIPNRVGRLDPRTAEFKDYVLPDPEADPHGLVVDAKGHVFWAETRGFHLGRLDPASGEMTRYPMDSSGKYPGRGHTPVIDSKQNIWYTAIFGDMIGKWDRQTQKTKVWKVPTDGAAPYGIVIDTDDKIWFAEFRRCKVARFDPVTEKFTEYEALTQPCTIRRLSIDEKGFVWYASFSEGKIGKLDPPTGKIVEYDIPMPYSEPYDIWPDGEGHMWVSDGGQGGTLIKFNPETEQFTYYPTPQRTDQPKLEISREGGIWYNPRSSSRAAVGVLYPDITRMTSLAAHHR